MKIKTTTTKEISIEFPAFTKYIDDTIEHYYCIESEKHITSFSKYKTINSYFITKFSSQYEALREGFVFIDKKEYLDKYQDLVDTLYDDMERLKLDLEDVTKEEEQGYEYNPETETMN
jgi:hypothetical protein